MKIEILGPGCSKCKQLTANAETAVKELNLHAEITKITDLEKMSDYGVMMTPALAIDGTVVASIPDQVRIGQSGLGPKQPKSTQLAFN